MTTTTSPPEVSRTAWDVVVTDDGIDELSKQLTASQLRTRSLGLLATASHTAQQVLDGKLLDGFTQLLQRLDLMSLVIEGWRSYTKLIDAARQSRSTIANIELTRSEPLVRDVCCKEIRDGEGRP